MGCETCKEITPNDYAKCIIPKGARKRTYKAPCGMTFSFVEKYTQPKKKKRR